MVLAALIEEVLAVHGVAYLIDLLEAHEVPCAPIHDIRQVVEHPQTQALGMLAPAARAHPPLIGAADQLRRAASRRALGRARARAAHRAVAAGWSLVPGVGAMSGPTVDRGLRIESPEPEIVLLTLARPQARNAVSHTALGTALREFFWLLVFDAGLLRCIVITARATGRSVPVGI